MCTYKKKNVHVISDIHVITNLLLHEKQELEHLKSI